MPNIAITGGAGAGKSSIIEGLKEHFPRAHFFSMDQFVADLYMFDETWHVWLMNKFGTCDRAELSEMAFANKEVMNELAINSAMRIGWRLGFLMNSNDDLAFFEFPLLCETGMEPYFFSNILITADVETRLDRIVARGKKDRASAQRVIDAQMTDEEKKKRVEYVIDTTDELIGVSVLQAIKFIEMDLK